MEVNFTLNNWKIERDEKNGTAKIVGKYDLIVNNKIIASQAFNGSYDAVTVPFSGDIMHKLNNLEKEILGELQKMVT